MKRQSDIGWFELIMGLILIILGIVIMRQPVGVLTWIVILCGVIAVISGIGDIVLYVKMERFTGFGPVVSLVTGILGIMAGFMLIAHPGAGTWAIASNLDHCTLYFQTFASPVYEDAFRNDVLYNLTDFEYSGADRRNPSDLPSDDHDFLDGCSGRRIPDHRGSRMHCDSLYRGTLLQIKTEIITKIKYTESSQLL